MPHIDKTADIIKVPHVSDAIGDRLRIPAAANRVIAGLGTAVDWASLTVQNPGKGSSVKEQASHGCLTASVESTGAWLRLPGAPVIPSLNGRGASIAHVPGPLIMHSVDELFSIIGRRLPESCNKRVGVREKDAIHDSFADHSKGR